MARKPTYEQLQERVKELETESADRRRGEREIETRNKILRAFLAESDQDMYDEVLKTVLSAFESEFGVVGHIDKEGNLVCPSMTSHVWDQCRIPDKGVVFPKDTWGDSIWGKGLRSGKSDYSNEPFRVPKGHVPINNCLTAPLVVQGKSIGLLTVGNKDGGYDEADRRILETIAESVAPVLQARLERKWGEEALRESKQFLDNVLNSIQSGISVLDGDLNIIRVNETMQKWYEHMAPLQGKKCYEAYQGRSEPCVACPSLRALSTGKLELEVVPLQRAEGFAGWLEVFGFPILDASGKATGVVEYVHDITERKRAEEALRESESRYSTLFTGITDAVLVHHITDDGRPGQFIDVNDVACKMLGYTRNELLGMGVGDIDAPESTVAVGPIVEDLKVGRDVLFEQAHVAKDGRRIPVEVHAQALDYKGRVAVLSTVRDMTERKSAEEALRQSEERYRTLFENSRDAIYITSREGEFLDVNQSWLDLFGYTREEMIGLNVHKIYVDPDEKSRFQRHIEQEGSVRNYAAKFRKKDGTEMECLITATVRQASDGSILGYQGVMRDITESKRLQAQLQQATKMEAIGTLAGGIAHDFNNLLMGIQGRTSLMFIDVSSDHPHFAHLTGIEDMVKRGADLSRQLLGFARGGKYKVRATDLNDVIEKSSEMFGRTKREIKVHGKYQKDIWAVEVDRGQIEQVLLNLYVNAWQAMSGGGDLYLETRNITLDKDFTKPFSMEPGNYVQLSVTDTGVGMDEATKRRVFEPFFSTKERGGGTGLGLASAYGIIKNHGGIINVQSELGHGTTIDIYLPASKKEVTGEEEPSVDILEGTETVLLVDDEDVILDVGKEMLATLGHRVMLASSGKQAIELYKQNEDKIDLVILDMIMPGMGGGETYDMLKEINPKIKVLLSSGYSIDGQANQILQRGCDGFIQKPFDIKRLSRAIRGTLEKA